MSQEITIPKYRCQQLGFDYIDKDKGYIQTLENLTPRGKVNFREAYGNGIGMILNFNKEYVGQRAIQSDSFKPPQYLHIVISNDHEENKSEMSKHNILNMQTQMITKLDTELILKSEQEESEFMKIKQNATEAQISNFNYQSGKNAKPIENQTIFVPYFQDEQNSTLDKECTMLLTQLSSKGKQKGIHSQSKLKKYLSAKIHDFLEKDDFEDQGNQRKMSNDSSVFGLPSVSSKTQKVIVLTLVCSDKMHYKIDKTGKKIFDILKEFIIQTFSTLTDQHDVHNVILGLNIMQGGQRLKNSVNEDLPNKIWKTFIDQNEFNKVDKSQTDSIEHILGSNVLTNQLDENSLLTDQEREDKNLQKLTKTTLFISLFFKLIGLVFGLIIIAKVIQDEPDFGIQDINNFECYSAQGSFLPLQRQTSNGKVCVSNTAGLCYKNETSPTHEVQLISKGTLYNKRGNYTNTDNPSTEVFNEYFTNAFKVVKYVFIVYLVITLFTTLVILLQIQTLGHQSGRFISILSVIKNQVPPIMGLTIIFMLYYRKSHEVQVCVCDYKETYYNLRKLWAKDQFGAYWYDHVLPLDNYTCDLYLGFLYDFLLYYEITLNLAIVAFVVYQYYRASAI